MTLQEPTEAAIRVMLSIPAHKLADMLREREPHREPDDGDTEMEITVEDARRIAWALMGHAGCRDELLQRISAAAAKWEIAPPLHPGEPSAGEASATPNRDGGE